MKHIGIYFILALSFIGCSDKYSGESGLKPTLTPRYINVSPTSLSFTANPNYAQSVSVETMETPWKIDNGINWVSLSSTSGNSSTNININASENTDGDKARTGVFYVLADVNDWNYETGVAVSQAAATPYINVFQTAVTLKGTACSTTIDVTSNCTCEISCGAEWLSISQKGNSITLTASANETNEYRNATIVLSHNGNYPVNTNIAVTQAPASINATTEALTFENTASEANVDVISEAKWTASTSYSWINVSPEKGEVGTSTLKISVSPNTSIEERNGYVILSIGNKERIQIPIKQRGIYVETDKSECNFDASTGTQTIQIRSNTSWQISNLPTWISVDKTNGSGNTEIKIMVEDNPNTTERNGEFLVSQPGLSAQAIVKVHQKGKTFDVASTTLTFTDKHETQNVSIATDGSWQASANVDWIMVSPKRANGDATLSITVSENNTDDERTGNVTVTMGDVSATIAVVQKGKYFTIDNNILNFTSKGGKLGVTMTTNATWNARMGTNIDWLTISPFNGSGNSEVTISASDNPSVNDRSTNVYIDALGRNVNVLVTQKARYLTIDTNELLFYSKGGTSNDVTISTDGEYSISSQDNWLTINRNENIFTVTASENTTKEARIGHISIVLTDLKQGTYTVTLTVTQLNYGGTFLRKDYEEDKNYDHNGTSSGSLTITGFGEDSNYDTNSQSGTKLSVVGFKSDACWDSSTASSAKVTITGYEQDKNLDSDTNSSGTVNKDGYSDDNNWN